MESHTFEALGAIQAHINKLRQYVIMKIDMREGAHEEMQRLKQAIMDIQKRFIDTLKERRFSLLSYFSSSI